MKNKFPIIKKKIKSFLQDEEGRISKHAIMTVGAIIGTAAANSLLTKADPLSLSVDQTGQEAQVAHSHHGSHGNHSSY